MRESRYVVVSHKNTPVMNHAKQISSFDNTKQTNLLIICIVRTAHILSTKIEELVNKNKLSTP